MAKRAQKRKNPFCDQEVAKKRSRITAPPDSHSGTSSGSHFPYTPSCVGMGGPERRARRRDRRRRARRMARRMAANETEIPWVGAEVEVTRFVKICMLLFY